MKNKKHPGIDASNEVLASYMVEFMESRGVHGPYSCSNPDVQKEIERFEEMRDAERQAKVLEVSVMQAGEEQQKKSI